MTTPAQIAPNVTLQRIQPLIYDVRGQQVMLDSDLAYLYGVETRVLNQAVKRNIERFPEDFMFQLTKKELTQLSDNKKDNDLKSQFVISSWGGKRSLPYAFTEQGIAMLSGVLRSPVAIDININIMRAFVALRRLLTENRLHELEIDAIKSRLARIEQDMDGNLEAVNDLSEDMRHELDNIYTAIGELSLRQHQADEQRNRPRIGFKTN